MSTVDPRESFDPLERMVVDQKRTIHVIAKPAEAIDRNPGSAPGHGLGIHEADTEILDGIALVLQLVGIVVVETGIAKSRFVYQTRRQNPRVGNHGLLDRNCQGMSVEL